MASLRSDAPTSRCPRENPQESEADWSPVHSYARQASMAGVRLENVRKVYQGGGSAHVAVHGIDLQVNDGEFMVLVGPSGSGKSTVLRMIAGLESITAGRLEIGGREVNQVAAKARDIAMVFQNYALYPHM